MKYEKFEEWMLGKKVTHVYAESSGVIVERPAEDDPDICVRVKYDEYYNLEHLAQRETNGETHLELY